MTPQIIATFGLICDIIGAVLVAIEVVKTFKGKISGTIDDPWEEIGKPSVEYNTYEKGKLLWMRAGLVFLVAGFSFQIWALWIPGR